MMLTELEMPVTAITATTDPIQSSPWTVNRSSMNVQPRWVNLPPSSTTPSSPESASATIRRRGEMDFVKSSQMPEPKAGTAQASSRTMSLPSSPWNQAVRRAPAHRPARIPMPPTRGTALTCIFCGPDRSWSADQCAWRWAEPTTMSIAIAEQAKAPMSIQIICGILRPRLFCQAM